MSSTNNLLEELSSLHTTSYNVIYIYTRPEYNNYCKIGQVSINTPLSKDQLKDNCDLLKKYSCKRINEQTKTASVKYNLNFCSLAIRTNNSKYNDKFIQFTDHQFHEILKKNGFHNLSPERTNEGKNIGSEWFNLAADKAIDYLKQYQNGKCILKSNLVTKIEFRPEQKEAIKKTQEQYLQSIRINVEGQMLWNAIMRFGKTLTTYGFVNELNKANNNLIKKVLIITHRPDVNKSWFDDYKKYMESEKIIDKYQYGSKNKEYGIDWNKIDKDKPFFFFISIQDLRGKETTDIDNNQINKREIEHFKISNKDFFDLYWDLVIVDEAHEGNTTELANEMHQHLKRKFTLYLSGTPFKLLEHNRRVQFTNDQIFDWDYVQEQKAKKEWSLKYPKIDNPYAILPTIKINCIELAQSLNDKYEYQKDISEGGFNFRIFFGINSSNGKFKHEKDIDKWLNNMCTEDDKDLINLNSMPFSSKNRDFNKHTMWYVPGVNEAKALEDKLKSHIFFQNYTIINAAGGNDGGTKILKKLLVNIERIPNKTPLQTRTITLTCGRLTTGVTVPEWTGILMLSNTTSAQTYFQTIFRCKTPWECNGLRKTQGIVYDFAPSRILEIISDYVDIRCAKKISKTQTGIISELINYLPMVSFEENEFKSISTARIMEGIKKIYIQNIVRTGFDSFDVFNNEAFEELSDIDISRFESKVLSGHSKGHLNKNLNNIELNTNNEGTPEFSLSSNGEQIIAKSSNDSDFANGEKVNVISKEEKEKRNKIKNLKLALLKISKRLPLMVLALEPKIADNFKLKDFPKKFDNEDWKEFMQEVTANDFLEITSKFFDEFALQGAVKKWCREMDDAFNTNNFNDQVNSIVNIFDRIKNPDKETVLTPWDVVKLHYQRTKIQWKEILSKNKGNVYLVDINAKSGLYSLYALWSLWKFYKGKRKPIDLIKKHIYVNCRTDAARKIVRRILGIRDEKYNNWANKHIVKYDIYENYKKFFK